jgi:hypothetical protein
MRRPAPARRPKSGTELELAADLEGVAAQSELQAHALGEHPPRGLVAFLDHHLGQIGVAAELCEAAHVVEELRFGVGVELDVGEVHLGHFGHKAPQVVGTVEGETQHATGEGGVAAAQIAWRGFEHDHAGPVLIR